MTYVLMPVDMCRCLDKLGSHCVNPFRIWLDFCRKILFIYIRDFIFLGLYKTTEHSRWAWASHKSQISVSLFTIQDPWKWLNGQSAGAVSKMQCFCCSKRRFSFSLFIFHTKKHVATSLLTAELLHAMQMCYSLTCNKRANLAVLCNIRENENGLQ